MKFQEIVFGDLGQLGRLVQNFAGTEPTLDHGPRLGLNEMVEIVQVSEVTPNIAIHNLVHLQLVSVFSSLLLFTNA